MTSPAPRFPVLHCRLLSALEVALIVCAAILASDGVNRLEEREPRVARLLPYVALTLPALLAALLSHRVTRWAMLRGAIVRPGLPAHFARCWVIYVALACCALVTHLSGRSDMVMPWEPLAFVSFPAFVGVLVGVLVAEHRAVTSAWS